MEIMRSDFGVLQRKQSERNFFFFYVLLAVHLCITLVINQLNAQNLVL